MRERWFEIRARYGLRARNSRFAFEPVTAYVRANGEFHERAEGVRTRAGSVRGHQARCASARGVNFVNAVEYVSVREGGVYDRQGVQASEG